MQFRLFPFLLFLVGCSPIPDFTLETCTENCNSCELDICESLCSELELAMGSPTCEEPANQVWVCAITVGCSFGEDCLPQIEDYLTCSVDD